MALKTQGAALALIAQLLDPEKATVPKIETPPQKPPFGAKKPILQAFRRASPESCGIESARVIRFLEQLRDDATLDPHSIMLLCGNTVISEADFGAYDHEIWHITHSECKSITGLAIGMLVGEGRLELDERVIKIFEARIPKLSLSPITLKNLTVRHLLTMGSGSDFNETGSVTEADWVRSFLDSTLKFEPGRAFNYNSMNTYMLAAIIREITGQTLMEYLRPRLFEPLGIEKIFWETCPRGTEKAGWGMYILPEDMAKIGRLVMQRGLWNGRQLVPASWIDEAISAKVPTPPEMYGFDYGYQIWAGRTRGDFLFNGMFGQNVLGFPGTDIMIVSNAGNDELFQQSNFYTIVSRNFPPDYHPSEMPLPEAPEQLSKLRRLEQGLRRPLPPEPKKSSFWDFLRKKEPEAPVLPIQCAGLSGRRFLTEENTGAAVGLIPLVMQATQNNYTKGLRSIGFETEGEEFIALFTERDEAFRLPVGFGVPKYADITFHGEPYRVAVAGAFATDEDDTTVLKLRISFLEYADERLLKIFFYGERVLMRFSERPGMPYISGAMDLIMPEKRPMPFAEVVFPRRDKAYMRFRLSSVLEPVLEARESNSKV